MVMSLSGRGDNENVSVYLQGIPDGGATIAGWSVSEV